MIESIVCQLFSVSTVHKHYHSPLYYNSNNFYATNKSVTHSCNMPVALHHEQCYVALEYQELYKS